MNCKTLPEALDFIAKRSGKDKLRNRSFVIACLKDLLPDQKAARNVLDAAFAVGVAEKFDESCGKAVQKQQMALSQCAMRLCDDHGFERGLVEEVLWAYGIAMGFEAIPEPKLASQPPPKPMSYPQVPNSKTVSVNYITNEIAKKYSDFLAAEAQYQGKRLRLTGTVESIQKNDFDGKMLIALQVNGESEAYIHAPQQSVVAQLKNGQTIEFLGTIHNFNGGRRLIIIDCELL